MKDEINKGGFAPFDVPATSTIPGYKCPKCDNEFSTTHGMRVHLYQKHIRGKRLTHEQRKANRREYQKQIRQRRLAQGLTSKGTPVKRPYHWTRQKGGLMSIERRQQISASLKGKRWTPQHRAAYRATMKRKKQELLNGSQQLTEEKNTADNMGESARAIIMAAQVLRSVAVGLKL